MSGGGGGAGPPILVTSAHRCGTTFVGRMLAEAPEVLYIQEPFNPFYWDVGVCSARFERFFTWVNRTNEGRYSRPLGRLMALKPNTLRSLMEVRDRDALDAVMGRRAQWSEARRMGRRALLKDPIALFSAPWLAQRFDAQVVVILRHPAGFVASVKRLGWQSALWDLVGQTGLAEAFFPEWQERAERLAGLDADIIDQAATFWSVCFSVIDDYRRDHPTWNFVFYEDLCERPTEAFGSLYHSLGLTFSAGALETIERFTSPQNPGEVAVGMSYAPVDSARNAYLWRERLSPEELSRVRAITAEVAERFYGSECW